MSNKKIKDMTKEEFLDLLEEAKEDNHIEVSGVIVSSSKCNLKEIEETANRLLEKHKDFLLLRKEIKFKTGYTG